MSEEITLSLPISSLEELRCFLCKGYLSCSPIRLLPNGECICGRCSPLNTDTLIHRLVAFEVVLSKISFPCLFKKHGCTETFLFGETTEHESKCFYKPVVCPIQTTASCSWEGPVSQLLHHFKDDHPDFMKDEATIKLEVDKDVQGVLMSNENVSAFIVKYSYQACERILKYDVRFCGSQNGCDVFAKIQLINGTDSDCSINLKMNECFSYDESFYGTQNAKVLNINEFTKCLGDPDCIVVALKLKVIKSNSKSVTTANDSGLIKTLKCYKCQNYLVPPLYDLNGKTVCCDCGKKVPTCTLSLDTDLLKLVNEAMYPCRWRECNFVGKSNIFKEHVMSCQFRQRCCVYNSCKTFKLSAAVDHLQTHLNSNVVYMPDKITYKMSFANYSGGDIFTIKNKRIILVRHQMVNEIRPYAQQISLYRSTDDRAHVIAGIVDFEHEHCTVKSKEFNVGLGAYLKVALADLPPCFKETDELTVTIELIC